jgi:hypothetical protein
MITTDLPRPRPWWLTAPCFGPPTSRVRTFVLKDLLAFPCRQPINCRPTSLLIKSLPARLGSLRKSFDGAYVQGLTPHNMQPKFLELNKIKRAICHVSTCPKCSFNLVRLFFQPCFQTFNGSGYYLSFHLYLPRKSYPSLDKKAIVGYYLAIGITAFFSSQFV